MIALQLEFRVEISLHLLLFVFSASSLLRTAAVETHGGYRWWSVGVRGALGSYLPVEFEENVSVVHFVKKRLEMSLFD